MNMIGNRNFIDEIIEMFLEQRAMDLDKDYTLNDFLSAIKTSENIFFKVKDEIIHLNNFLPYFQEKIKSKINVDFVGISSPFIILKTDTPVEEIAQALDIDKKFVKSFPLTSSIDIILIDLSETTEKEDENSLNVEILDFIHEIGVKYINCEKIDEEEMIYRCNHLIEKIKSVIGNPKARISIQIKNYHMYISIYDYVNKEQFCQKIGLQSDLFFEIDNPYVTYLVCDCPRIVFEEFYDKNEWEDARGADKWLI